MKSDGEILEILVAHDRAGSLRAAADLAGGSHHTVAKHVQARDAGDPLAPHKPRAKRMDRYLGKISELVDVTHGNDKSAG